VRTLCVLAAAWVSSFAAGAADMAPWSAQWIGIEGENAPNTWLCYRTTVDLPEAPATATARIACDSRYWLWVNGEIVVREGQLKRGPTPQDTYFDTVDLSGRMRPGENTVAVLVWFWGRHGFAHNNSGKSGLVFEADLGGTPLLSDASWKVIKHPAFEGTGDPHPNYRLAEANIRFDARRDPGHWQAPGYDDSAWAAADTFGVPPVAPWNQLEPRPVLQWADSGLLDYEAVREEPAEGGRVVIGALPYNRHVTPYLEVRAPEGECIDIRMDNYRGGGTENVRAEYVTRAGRQAHETPGWMNGHEVHYTVPDGVEVLRLAYRATGYNADMTGAFRCDDDALNQLWEESRRTLYVTMRDNFMDCPDRERAQWWGDAVNEIGETFYVFDAERGPMLARKAILELARWQKPDKALYSPVPSGLPTPGVKHDGSYYSELPRQMLASVGWYGFWLYYVYTGDAQTIERVYPHVRDYLSLYQLGDDGLCIHRKGDWDWTDWGRNKDVPVIENAFLYLALKGAVAMAELTGHEDDVAGYEAVMESIEANFNPTFWQGDRYRSPGYKGETDDRAQGLAVVAGLADPSYYPAIRQVLSEEHHASPYLEKYVLESLYLMGAPEDAVARMKRRYASMLADPWSTLWENFGNENEPGSGTYNHAWSGGPLTLLGQYGAGISPASPGFGTFTVAPQMGPLREIDTIVPTQNGDIELKLRRADDKLTLDLVVPPGSTAAVDLARGFGPVQGLKINGNAAPAEALAELKEGAWTIEAAL